MRSTRGRGLPRLWLVLSCLVAVLGTAAVTGAAGASAEGSACTLNHSERQICAAAPITAAAASAATVTVASYEDLSSCSFAAPAGEPGNNGRYTVASVSINWGDGTPATSGSAVTGSSCGGTEEGDEVGQPEPVTGTHTFAKPGAYRVTVTVIYVRASGNTYPNCATASGAQVYNVLTNCIALGAPVTTMAVVRAAGVKVPKLIGKTLGQARKALTTAHLKLGRVTRRGRARRVIRQSLRAGQLVNEGSSVTIVLR